MKMRAFFSFALVGVVGFVVDSGLLWIFAELMAINALIARLPSFLCAVTVTWVLNGRLTFNSNNFSLGSWLAYVAANGMGFSVNYLIYASLMAVLGIHPVVAVAISSGIALIVNFIASSRLAFKRR